MARRGPVYVSIYDGPNLIDFWSVFEARVDAFPSSITIEMRTFGNTIRIECGPPTPNNPRMLVLVEQDEDRLELPVSRVDVVRSFDPTWAPLPGPDPRDAADWALSQR